MHKPILLTLLLVLFLTACAPATPQPLDPTECAGVDVAYQDYLDTLAVAIVTLDDRPLAIVAADAALADAQRAVGIARLKAESDDADRSHAYTTHQITSVEITTCLPDRAEATIITNYQQQVIDFATGEQSTVDFTFDADHTVTVQRQGDTWLVIDARIRY